ncbi:hypothetical protein PVAP13_6KG095535 [Panicum virgatum]|uniref:Uncharacterized protein n=1 Tax=Panicum virgatum TaxID=38727 RepID=A0A8T0RBS2_PANVG|nr:hypothetical protein PVAP13_6KG095535 [Panicum virgatum]
MPLKFETEMELATHLAGQKRKKHDSLRSHKAVVSLY